MNQHEDNSAKRSPEGSMLASHLRSVVDGLLKNLRIYEEITRYIAFWCDAYITCLDRNVSKASRALTRRLGNSGRSRGSDFQQLFRWVLDTHPSLVKCSSWNLVKCLANHTIIREGLLELAQIIVSIHSNDVILNSAERIHGRSVVKQMLKIPEYEKTEIELDELSNCISLIMTSKEYWECAISLRGEDALVLIDLINHFLDFCPPDEENFPRCIRTLKRMCTLNNVLPTALVLTDGLSTIKSVPETCGGFADIYQGLYRGKLVALKSLRVYGNSDLLNLRKAFRKEVIVWSHLEHPNIVPFLGVADEEKFEQFPLCMVSHWMEHGTLLEYIRNFPSANRLGLLVDVAGGLQYLHQYIVHGDLKGTNVLIDGQKRARISDFGLAIVTNDTRSKIAMNASTTNSGAGSVRWMAPELIDPDESGVLSPTRKSDIYALAMVMLEAFTGAVPFHGQLEATVIMRVLKGKRPERPSDALSIGLLDSMWSLIERCWHPSPDERPPMLHVLRELEDLRNEFARVTRNCPVATPDTSADLVVIEKVDRTSVLNIGDLPQLEGQVPLLVVEDDLETTVRAKAVEETASWVSRQNSPGRNFQARTPTVEEMQQDYESRCDDDSSDEEQHNEDQRPDTKSTLDTSDIIYSYISEEPLSVLKPSEIQLSSDATGRAFPFVEPDDPSSAGGESPLSSSDSQALKFRMVATKLRLFFPDERQYLQEILRKSEARMGLNIDPRGSQPGPGDPTIHVFVDYSNIFIGFMTHVSQYTTTFSTMNHLRKSHLNYNAFSLILERGRPISKRTIAVNSPLSDSMKTAQNLGYDVNIHTPAPEQDLSTLIHSFRSRRSGGITSRSSSSATSFYSVGHDTTFTPSTTPSDSLPYTPLSYREHGGAEQLKLRLYQTIISSNEPAPGSTIILATGDGNVGKYNENMFVGCVRTALRRGWSVELYTWEFGLGKVWKREFAKYVNFKAIYLEKYIADLLELD